MKIFRNRVLSRTTRLFLTLALLVGTLLPASAIKGSDFTGGGGDFYLFNVYQAKFLSWGNQWGTQASLDNTNPLKVTITSSSGGYTINTHLEPTAKGVVVNSSYDNYLFDCEWDGVHWPVVNAKYYENGSVIERTATVWNITKHEQSGYYQIKNGDLYLAYNEKNIHAGTQEAGWACELTSDISYAPDRSYWMLISKEDYDKWTDKKKVVIASLNVDGLPKSITIAGVYTKELNPDGNEGPGATAIGQRLLNSGFDIVGVSEDFNYHSELWKAAWNDGAGYNATTHRGSISADVGAMIDYIQKNPVVESDGLCTFYKVSSVDGDGSSIKNSETWTEWNEHYGYTDSGADGLIRKGYRFSVVTLADGTQLDLYTLHMDAETNPGDNAARASQLTQLADAIKVSSNRRPILIIGDSNCRYTRDNIKGLLIDAINEDPRFTIRDPWIQYGRNSVYPLYPSGSIMASSDGYLSGEVVDKIWYINNKESNIRLVAETYAQDLSFVWEKDGVIAPLCDHKPCVVTFSYRPYDAETDDQPVEEVTEATVYIRNRATGRYLKSGGFYAYHAVVGNYPIPFTITESSKTLVIKSVVGYLFNTGQPYIDGKTKTEWNVDVVDGNFMVLSIGNQALTANDPFLFNEQSDIKDWPNYRWVITEEKDLSSKLQQWEIVTEEQMLEELKLANKQNPVNASWLMSNPNFDLGFSNDKWSNNIASDAKRMTTDLCGGRRIVIRKDSNGNPVLDSNNKPIEDPTDHSNLCGEAYVSTCPDYHSKYVTCSHETRWDINQTINNIPNGYYRVTCQAFQRVNYDASSTDNDIKFYANSNETTVTQMYTIQETNSSMGSTQNGSYYYPNSMDEASQYFLKGYYQHSLLVNITDGTLTFGLKKTSKSKSDYNTSTWCCFDNFQLFYLGTEDPSGTDAENSTYSELDVLRTAVLSDENKKLTLTGNWRVLDEDEMKTAAGDNPLLVIDATNATLISKPTLPVADGTNVMLKVKDASQVANTKNVLAGNTCENFVLTDKKDFAPEQTFTATKSYYTRTNTLGYNTVCMPFELYTSDFPGCKVYTYTDMTATTLRFTELDEGAEIPAGTPILVYSPTGDDWMLDLTGRAVVPTVTGNEKGSEQAGMNGSFLAREIGAEYYKLNSAGTKFAKTTDAGKIVPFRFYLKTEAAQASAPAFSMSFVDGETTDIEEMLNSKDNGIEETYDLNGHRVLNITRPGIYVKNGKKIIKK